MLLNVMGHHDPLMKDALMTISEQGDFIKSAPNDNPGMGGKGTPPAGPHASIENDPTLVGMLIKSNQTSIETVARTIQTKSGAELFDFILEHIQQVKKILFDPQSSALFMAAINKLTPPRVITSDGEIVTD